MQPLTKTSTLALMAQVQALHGGLKAFPLPAATSAKPVALSHKAAQGKEAQQAQLMKACQDFESVFWNFIMQSMRQAGVKSDFIDSSQEHDIFTSMQDEELSKNMAQSGSLGISRMLFEQLKKTVSS